VYRQTLSYLEPLHDRLARRAVDDELLTGLWMIARHARARNYLAANDVYLRLAIGNKAWPIGVTSVGIHERSAREKIAEHTADGRGGAHIMADEASRKFLQAVKRLLGVVQRLRPTDPSRAADFNAASGAIVLAGGGGGSAAAGGRPMDERAALRLADARGDTSGLAPAPSVVDERDGSVRIPPKWDAILARERAALEQERRWARGQGGK
jgi:pre-mRNA-splicing factor 18